MTTITSAIASMLADSEYEKESIVMAHHVYKSTKLVTLPFWHLKKHKQLPVTAILTDHVHVRSYEICALPILIKAKPPAYNNFFELYTPGL